MKKSSPFKKVQCLTNQALIADKCHEAKSYFDRLRGLIGRTSFSDCDGMLFPKCNNIHMWFMSMPIDVVFLRKEDAAQGSEIWKISSVRPGIQPWRLLPVWDPSASETLELPAGTIERFSLRAGDTICIS